MQQEYFFYKNTLACRALNWLLIGLALVLMAVIALYFLADSPRPEWASILMGALIAVFTSLFVTVIHHKLVVMPEKSQLDEAAIQSLYQSGLASNKITKMLIELRYISCTHPDIIKVNKRGSECTPYKPCNFLSQEGCLLHELAVTLPDGILKDIDRGIQLCTNVKPSLLPLFSRMQMHMEIVRKFYEQENKIGVNELRKALTVERFLLNHEPLFPGERGTFPEYTDVDEVRAAYEAAIKAKKDRP